MDLGLAGKGVIVTGASRGIGRAIAHAFAAEGAHVAICARGEHALLACEAELRGKGSKVYAARCDVTDETALYGFIDAAHAAFGRIDVLVNNTSAMSSPDDDESWRANFEVDVLASARATRHVVPLLEASGGGSIVFISSTSALEAPGPAPYSAMKAAQISHSKNLAVELAPRGIRVNTVAPGSIEFPGGIWEEIRETQRENYDAIRATIPFGRLGTPEEVANAVAFIASDRASWITGAVLSVDGGQHKGNL